MLNDRFACGMSSTELDAYFDGELAASQLCHIAGHIDSCAECAQREHQHLRYIGELRSVDKAIEVRPELLESFRLTIRQGEKQTISALDSTPAEYKEHRSYDRALGFAVGAVALAAGALFVIGWLSPVPSDGSLAENLAAEAAALHEEALSPDIALEQVAKETKDESSFLPRQPSDLGSQTASTSITSSHGRIRDYYRHKVVFTPRPPRFEPFSLIGTRYVKLPGNIPAAVYFYRDANGTRLTAIQASVKNANQVRSLHRYGSLSVAQVRRGSDVYLLASDLPRNELSKLADSVSTSAKPN